MKYIPDALQKTSSLNPALAIGFALNGLTKAYAATLDYTLHAMGQLEGQTHHALLIHNADPCKWCHIAYKDDRPHYPKLRVVSAQCTESALAELYNTDSIIKGTEVDRTGEVDDEGAAYEAEQELYGAQNEQSR